MSEKNWREIAAVKAWEHADRMRNSILRDTPSLDVRIRTEDGLHVIEISGPERR